LKGRPGRVILFTDETDGTAAGSRSR